MKDLKFEAMLQTMKQIEDLTTSLNKDVNKNRKQMRLEAIAKIQEYFKEKLELCEKYDCYPRLELSGISINDYGDRYNLHIFFEENSTVTFWQLGTSTLEINDFCNLTEKDMLYNSSDGKISTWHDGFLDIINNWHDIKEAFEVTLEKYIQKHCADLTKNAQDNLNTALYLKNFEV